MKAKNKLAVVGIVFLVVGVLIFILIKSIPVIGHMAHENRSIVSADEPHTILYASFDDDFDVSDKGRFAGIVEGAYHNYIAYYVKGDAEHQYLYVDSCFYKKVD